MKVRIAIIFSGILFGINQSFAFVHQKTLAGDEFRWPSNATINLYVNGANSSGISSFDIATRAASSASSWSESGGPALQVISTTGAPQDGRSDVYFSTDPTFFSSSSILAVTESRYSQANGSIIESDIMIKDSVLFSNSQTSSPFIGDILSHEMGHLLGMDHATLPFSTMFYKLTRGQFTPSYDDHLGKSMLYSATSGGSIKGTIAGGENVVGVFAADVQLISSLEGKVIASTLTDQDGSFSFEGVPTGDMYFLYVQPLKVKDSLSPYYQTAKSDFCTGFVDFKGSFFESCDSSRKGHPQGIDLTNGTLSVDVGVVTIKCNLNIPINYFTGRANGNFVVGNADRNGDSFTGFFTETDITNGVSDILTVDMSHLDASSGNLYLDLALISQDFNSKVAFEMEVRSPVGTYFYNYGVDTDFNPNLNLRGRIPLDPLTSANNVFEIEIRPLDFDTFISTTPYSLESLFFPDFSTVGDSRFFYQFIFFVSQSSGSNYPVYSHYSYPTIRGNSQCMDGQKTYGVKSAGAVTGVTSESFNKKAGEPELVACGSVAIVDDNDSNGPGPMGSLFVGLLVSFLLFSMGKKTRFD